MTPAPLLDGWADRWAARGMHLIESRAMSAACPLWLIGKRCRNTLWPAGCLCATRLNDHGNKYRGRGGKRLVIWEPYGVDGLDLADLTYAARHDGIRVTVEASEYYPGHTVAIIFEAQAAAS